MMRFLVRVAVCLTAALFLASGAAFADGTINFDNLPDGTIINNTYAGVTFACFGTNCPSGNVYARNFDGSALSTPNVVSTLATGFPYQQDSVDGAIEVIFSTPQTSVSIENFLTTAPEGLGTTGYGYLQGYDSSLNYLGAVTNTNLNAWTNLTFSAAGISFALIGDVGGGQNYISLFDNLSYSSGGGTGTTVPEPSSLLMLGTGLMGLVVASKKILV